MQSGNDCIFCFSVHSKIRRISCLNLPVSKRMSWMSRLCTEILSMVKPRSPSWNVMALRIAEFPLTTQSKKLCCHVTSTSTQGALKVFPAI
ncbi:hypothetical protein V5799_002657 [Amblyomma americanum]|uniref:Uncharacterized protein n=1 Tax=Amblyomma americanum TaxID=6943 RepID=A0AAQ4DB70_AMBAM